MEAVFAFGLANIKTLEKSLTGFNVAHWLNGLQHLSNANTQRGSRRNIAAHYDLGNAFYRAWLDEDMNYSSGLYFAGKAKKILHLWRHYFRNR